MKRALKIGAISVFAALHVTLWLLPFPSWRNWAVFLEPLEGIILGPIAGFLAAFTGSGLGRIIKPDDFWMFAIVAEPLGVFAAGFLAKGKWKPVAIMFVIMLGAYFIDPIGRTLPLWTILDVLVALALVYPAARFGKSLYEMNSRRLVLASALIFFVGTVADSLTRVFLLVPARFYNVFFPAELLHSVFVTGAIQSFAEDGLAIVASVLIGVPVIVALKEVSAIKYPLT